MVRSFSVQLIGLGDSILNKIEEDWFPLPLIGNVVVVEEEFVISLSLDTETALVNKINRVVMGSN